MTCGYILGFFVLLLLKETLMDGEALRAVIQTCLLQNALSLSSPTHHFLSLCKAQILFHTHPPV